MSVKVSPITPQTHAKTKVKPLTDFSAFKERHISPLTVHEFSRAASSFPIVFIKNPKSEEYKVVALLSVEQNNNAFVTEDGKWTANYLPQSIARIPFYISSDEKPVMCIDDNDPRVNEEEGEALFDDKGEKTEFFEKVLKSMQALMDQEVVTNAFTKTMVDLDLMKGSNLTIAKKDGTKQEITGIYLVDEEKLKALADDKVLELHKKGFLGLIYAHMCSLGQTHSLIG